MLENCILCVEIQTLVKRLSRRAIISKTFATKKSVRALEPQLEARGSRTRSIMACSMELMGTSPRWITSYTPQSSWSCRSLLDLSQQREAERGHYLKQQHKPHNSLLLLRKILNTFLNFFPNLFMKVVRKRPKFQCFAPILKGKYEMSTSAMS